MKRFLFHLLILSVVLNINAQVEQQWNLITDSYKHNSSNYAPNHPPIETTILSNHHIVTFTQNGTFMKIDSQGNSIWKKSLESSSRQRILSDKDDNIFLIRGSIVEKYDSGGELIWSKDYSEKLRKNDLLLTAFTTDHEGNLYICANIFYTKSLLIFKTDTDGEVLWKKKIQQKIHSWHYLDECKEVLFHNDNIYALQYNYGRSGSKINKLTSNGKQLEKFNYNDKIKQVKAFNGFIYAVGNTGSSTNDQIKIKKFDKHFTLLDSIDFKLSRNVYYTEKAQLSLSFATTKEEFEKRNVTAYDVNDFIIDSKNKYQIVGSANGQWRIMLNENGKLLKDERIFDEKFYNHDNITTVKGQEISTIKFYKDTLLLSGISYENDDHEERFVNNINLFLKSTLLD